MFVVWEEFYFFVLEKGTGETPRCAVIIQLVHSDSIWKVEEF